MMEGATAHDRKGALDPRAVARAADAAGDRMRFFTFTGSGPERPSLGDRVWVVRPGDRHDKQRGQISGRPGLEAVQAPDDDGGSTTDYLRETQVSRHAPPRRAHSGGGARQRRLRVRGRT